MDEDNAQEVKEFGDFDCNPLLFLQEVAPASDVRSAAPRALIIVRRHI